MEVNIYLLASFLLLFISGSSLAATHVSQAFKEERTSRRGVYDAADPLYDRFRIEESEIKMESIIASRQNIYIRFPILELESRRLEEILSFPPKYVIEPKETRENKRARLLLYLYENGKYATFLNIYKYFIERYKDSKYGELIDNLAAEVYYKIFQRDGQIYDFNRVRAIYAKLEEKYPRSKLRERNDLILAYTNLKLKRGVDGVQGFTKILDRYKKSEDYDFVMLSLAEGYILLNRPNEALRIYKKLEEEANPRIGIEASYIVGDVYLHTRNFKKAVESYQLAIKKYPGVSSRFANAYYNMAEALFWLGRYRESLQSYLSFVETFPFHKHGGYALTRIGELLGVLGADQKRVMDTFLECHFRFKGHHGAQISRIRILSQKMKSMKVKALKSALIEMNEIASHSQLPNMSEFVAAMIAEGFYRRGEYDKALAYLILSFRQKSGSPDFFKKKIITNIISKIKNLLDSGDAYGALTKYEKQKTTWLKYSDRVDLDYFLGEALEGVGMFDEAISKYKNVLLRLESMRGSLEEKERQVNEISSRSEYCLLKTGFNLCVKRGVSGSSGRS